MKLLYIAVHEQNKEWGAEYFVNKGFINNHVETICIDYREARKDIVNKLQNIGDFDYCLLQRGDYFPIKLLQAINRPCFFWASELVARNKDQNRLFRCGIFDRIFVHTKACKQEIIRNGWLKEDSINILLNGFDPECHYPIDNIKKEIDVLFIGNLLPRRRKWLDEIKKYFNVHEAIGIYGNEMVKLVNRSKIVLNIHSEEFLDTETRVYEILGCRSFLLTEKLSEDSPFINGKHLVEVDGLLDMIDKIHYYLAKQQIRETIANEGYREVISKHSYSRRVIKLIRIFKQYPVNNSYHSIDILKCKKAYFSSYLLYLYVSVSEYLRQLKRKAISQARKFWSWYM